MIEEDLTQRKKLVSAGILAGCLTFHRYDSRAEGRRVGGMRKTK